MCGIFRKITEHALWIQRQIVVFVETGFIDRTELIVVQQSVTNRGIPEIIDFISNVP
jgi:hypothetical protein